MDFVNRAPMCWVTNWQDVLNIRAVEIDGYGDGHEVSSNNPAYGYGDGWCSDADGSGTSTSNI